MGMLKVFAGIASLLIFVMPSLLQAKSIADGNRYICETEEAAGWKENGEVTNLALSYPETQYIIEPKEINYLYPKLAEEGYIEKTSTHAISLLGSNKPEAFCNKGIQKNSMYCFKRSSNKFLEKGSVDPYQLFTITLNESGGYFLKNRTTSFMYSFKTMVDISNDLGRVSLGGLASSVLEVGECKKF